MADDDKIFDDLPADTSADAASSDAARAKAQVTPQEAADDARFADLVAGASDLFTHAMDRIQRDTARAEAAWSSGQAAALDTGRPKTFRSDEEMAAFDVLSRMAHQAQTIGDDETRAEKLAEAKSQGVDIWPEQHLTGRDPRLIRDRRQEREIVAEAMLRQLGAAGHAAASEVRTSYLDLPRIQQAALLALSGDDRSARRGVAARIGRALPTLAERLVNWMEDTNDDAVERQGLALAATLDRQAQTGGDPFLSMLATEVLMVSLRSPLTRIVDLAPDRVQSTMASWAGPLAERQATPSQLTVDPAAPLSAEAVDRLKLLTAGVTPLPFTEGRLSLTEPARRVLQVLARSLHGDGPITIRQRARHEIGARLEPVLFGLGLLLAGVPPRVDHSERSLLRAANHMGQQHLTETTTSFELKQSRRVDAVQRKRAEEVKTWKTDLEEVLPKLEAARAALEKLGLDEAGQPLGRDDHDGGGIGPAAASFTAIVCPHVETRTNAKVREAVAGHEHTIGKPLDLVATGDLPAKRRQLIAEFPWAGHVIDFILTDLVNRQTVTIRPVLLVGTPGSGKTHFARRFADVFGLHTWSVDCGGSDGSVFSGTDRRWHSAEPSHPFLAMSRGKTANPLVILDELEKAPTRADYGRLWDALLPFLESGSNKAVQDRCLQVEIDGSHINYIATANRIDPLPWPLRDRFRQIAFPEPSADHIEALIPPLLAHLAAARSLDPRFISDLTAEDRAFLARRWKGGSVRRLARLIEAVVNARERAMPLN